MSKLSTLVCASLSLFVGGAIAADNPAKVPGKSPAWKHLFNGNNLNGWSAHYASKTAANAPPPSSFFEHLAQTRTALDQFERMPVFNRPSTSAVLRRP